MLEKSSIVQILASFSKLGDLVIDLFAKEVALVTFTCPEVAFPGNSTNSVFSFWLYRMNE